MPQAPLHFALHTIQSVDVFATGKHNGRSFTENDLDEIVAAANDADAGLSRVPLKRGHTDEVGAPALGWATNIRRDGNRLVADFVDIPDSVYDVIKDRAYDSRSAEIYFNLKRNGKTLPKALGAVALLGAEMPAVPNLTPLGQMAFSEDDYEGREFIESENKESFTMTKEEIAKLEADKVAAEKRASELEARLKEKETPVKVEFKQSEEYKEMSAKIDALNSRIRQDSIKAKVEKLTVPALRPFVEAFYRLATKATEKMTFSENGKDTEITAEEMGDKLIDTLNAQAKLLFKEWSGSDATKKEEGPTETPQTFTDAGDRIHALTMKFMQEKNVDDYSKALDAVLNDPANKELKEIYAH
jgi:hypothetical protein